MFRVVPWLLLPSLQMLLVVDIVKGVQTQTAEVCMHHNTAPAPNSQQPTLTAFRVACVLCVVDFSQCLVIGEITTPNMIIVLNKADLLPPSDRDAKVPAAALLCTCS